MECAWFLIAAGQRLGCEEAIQKGKQIIDITLPLGTDKKHGGFISFADISGRPPLALEWDMKLWWPQCEAMIALRLAYLQFNDEKYNELYNEIKEYCEKYFCDDECGEWYGYLHYDNTVSTTLKGNIFKGPFHIPRLYMIMASMDETNGITEYMK
jgi:N-acylglucosamine 2-epimerase